MESFIYTAFTTDGYPVVICGLCTDGNTKICIESLSSINNIKFGSYTSGFTIDYRLERVVNDCIKEIIREILLIGASIHVGKAECSTGGIFGIPNGEFISSEDILISEDNFICGFKPGRGAFGAFITNDEVRKKITDRFENYFSDDMRPDLFYGELLDISDKFIMITDGSGEDAFGIAANETDYVTLKEVENRYLEQKDYFGLKKIGVLGGTFDPIHNGHLIAAQTVCDKLHLDKVIFVPTGNTTYKEAIGVSPGETRYSMASLAVESNDMFCVSSIEIDKLGIAYTEDTIEDLMKHCDKDVEIYFILGSDVMQAVSCWKGFDKLSNLCEFVAVTRPGYTDEKIYNIKTIKNSNAKVHYLEVPALDISSSYIRKAISEGKSIKYLLPDEVEKYIYLHRLYKGKKTISIKEDAELYRILKLIH